MDSLPNILYHYTSQAGLLGIIQTREIWATNLLFLNDSMELNYALQILHKEIKNLEKSVSPEEFGFVNEFGENLDTVNAPLSQNVAGIYVCSFSKTRDQLSQWIGYCPDEGGFSIGFDFNLLPPNLFKDQGFAFVKCIYDEKEQSGMIVKFLNTVIEAYCKNGVDPANTKRWEDFFSLAPQLKHPKFEDEQEWRLISKPTPIEDAEFRIGKSMLVPYLKIRLAEAQDKSIENKDIKKPLCCISEIYIGPTTHPNLSNISLENLLSKEGIIKSIDCDSGTVQKCEIKKSEIPYRPLGRFASR
jgi:hypothetical protein